MSLCIQIYSAITRYYVNFMLIVSNGPNCLIIRRNTRIDSNQTPSGTHLNLASVLLP